jgi:acetoacetyl-CoA reductase
MSQDKKTALVTGGTRGIGAEISKALKADGYRVIANFAGNKQAAKAFKDETGIETLCFDVSNFESVQKACAGLEVDVLVNNAGITRDRMLHKMGLDDWQDVMRVNLDSCFNLCRALVPNMRTKGWGRVINISSINGQKGQMGQCNYAAAKAGMIGFTKSLALENAIKKITVNAICPGYIETEMTGAMDAGVLENIVRQIPQGRMGKAEEIAGIVSFLASEKAAFINGATITANGGQYVV